MSKHNNNLLEELRNTVVAGDIQKARKIAERIVNCGLSANTALEKLMEAMRVVDRRYDQKEFFVIDVAAAATAMREAFKVLEPYLQVESTKIEGKIVIGSLKGNFQGLGKDIVAATLRAAGFQVTDLGVNVEPEKLVDAAVQADAQIIAISVSMDESVQFLKEVVDCLKKKGLREKIRVIVGGRAVSEKTCSEYDVDAYAKDAWDCVKKIERLLGR